MIRRALYFLLVIAILGMGIGTFIYLVKTAPRPEGMPDPDPGRLVRAFRANQGPHRVAITAFGTSRARREYSAIAEVSGRAVEVHEKLEVGEILPAGALLARVDPADYQVDVRRYEAEVRSAEYKLAETAQERENLSDTLSILEGLLDLSSSELARQKNLFSQGTSTQADLETVQNRYLQQDVAVQKTKNDLALLPVREELQHASLDLARAQLERATTNLAKTEIRLPFEARVAMKSIEANQYVPVGQSIGSFFSIDKAEVVAAVEAREIMMLGLDTMGATQGLSVSSNGDRVPFWEHLEIPAEVLWRMGSETFRWKGRVTRFGSGLDPKTRTVAVTIEVPDPYKDASPGTRPPLLPDMFCETVIYGATLEEVTQIPRDALRNDRVHLAKDGRLATREVEVLALEKGLAIIGKGLETGDLVILTDVFPAAEGMKVRAEEVANPAPALLAESRGDGDGG